MENLSEFYTQTDKDTLALIDFHQNLMMKAEEAGQAAPDSKQTRELLEGFRSIIDKRVKHRKDRNEVRLEGDRTFMESRLKAYCFKCNTERAVKITGEEKHPVGGFICDVVICSVCGKEFLNAHPNNWDDRMKFFDHFLEQIMTVNDSGLTISEQVMTNEEAMEMVRKCETAKRSHLEAKQREAELLEAEVAADAAITAIHDQLLQAKLSLLNYGNIQATA